MNYIARLRAIEFSFVAVYMILIMCPIRMTFITVKTFLLALDFARNPTVFSINNIKKKNMKF